MASSAWLPITYRQTVNDYRKIQMPKCGPSDDRQEICRTMINSFSTGFSMTVSTKDIGHRRIKNFTLARLTQNESADEKKRSISGKTTADELSTVARIIPSAVGRFNYQINLSDRLNKDLNSMNIHV